MRVKVTKNYLRNLIKEEVKKALVMESMNPQQSLDAAVSALSMGPNEIIHLPAHVNPCAVWNRMGRKYGLAVGQVRSLSRSGDEEQPEGPIGPPATAGTEHVMGSLMGLRNENWDERNISVSNIRRVGDMCKTKRRREPARQPVAPPKRTAKPPPMVQDDIPLVNPYE
jgi:hypothetical protein